MLPGRCPSLRVIDFHNPTGQRGSGCSLRITVEDRETASLLYRRDLRLTQAFLGSSHDRVSFLNLSRSRLRPFQVGRIIDKQPFLRQDPIIEHRNGLAMEMLESEIGDAQRIQLNG
jgi:hypothetical protein